MIQLLQINKKTYHDMDNLGNHRYQVIFHCVNDMFELRQVYPFCRGRRGPDRMVVGFTTISPISAHHH
jgi:hypothetical protein